MVRLILIPFMLSLVLPSGQAQKVFTVPYASQADAVLYETKNKLEADILIFKVGFSSQVNPAEGLWMNVKFKSQADWKVYWTNHRSSADCLVYFVPHRSQAKRNGCFFRKCRK